jgi:hypothetical protein
MMEGNKTPGFEASAGWSAEKERDCRRIALSRLFLSATNPAEASNPALDVGL